MKNWLVILISAFVFLTGLQATADGVTCTILFHSDSKPQDEVYEGSTRSNGVYAVAEATDESIGRRVTCEAMTRLNDQGLAEFDVMLILVNGHTIFSDYGPEFGAPETSNPVNGVYTRGSYPRLYNLDGSKYYLCECDIN